MSHRHGAQTPDVERCHLKTCCAVTRKLVTEVQSVLPADGQPHAYLRRRHQTLVRGGATVRTSRKWRRQGASVRECCTSGGRSKLAGIPRHVDTKLVLEVRDQIAHPILACCPPDFSLLLFFLLAPHPPPLQRHLRHVWLCLWRAHASQWLYLVSCCCSFHGGVLIVQQVPEEGFCFDPRTPVTLRGTPAGDVTRALLGGGTTGICPSCEGFGAAEHAAASIVHSPRPPTDGVNIMGALGATQVEVMQLRALDSCDTTHSTFTSRRTWRNCCRG